MTDEDEAELSEFLSDPVSVFFDLNDDLLDGMDRIRYALGYSFWAGGLITIVSVIAALWALTDEPTADSALFALFLAFVALASAYACYSARAERSFLEDYSILGRGVQRANRWKPDPKIPAGPDPLARLVAHLKATDERIGYILDEDPEELEKDAMVKGKSKVAHRFDLFMAANKPIGLVSDPLPEGMILLVRKVEKATVEDLKALKKSAEDVLRKLHPIDQSARVLLLQTGGGKFSEDVVKLANEDWMTYERSTDESVWDWSSPVELIAECPDGKYVLESTYFG